MTLRQPPANGFTVAERLSAARVAVCIPTFDRRNGRADKLLASVAMHTPARRWLSYVDDGQGVPYSQSGIAYVARQQRAVEWAIDDGHLMVLAVNDDVTVSPGWLGPLVEAIIAGAWCATPDATATDGPQIYAPYCMLWRADAWQYLGGLDLRYAHWSSDIDLARRLVDAGHPPVRVMLPNPVRHELNATSAEQPELGPVCAADLDRFRQKWGVDAESEKHRLAALS